MHCRYGLISDTHGHLHPEVFRHFAGVEAILHAGDVGGESVLFDLSAIAPTHAVAGNIDPPGPLLPPMRIIQFPFGRVVVTHSHLLDDVGRDPESLARHFAPHAPRVIVFGHSHRACAVEHDGILVVNPGPAGKPRFRDKPSIALLTWDSEDDRLAVRPISLRWKKP